MTATILYALAPVLLLGVLPVVLLVLRDRLTGRRGVTVGEAPASGGWFWAVMWEPLLYLVVPVVGAAIGIALA